MKVVLCTKPERRYIFTTITDRFDDFNINVLVKGNKIKDKYGVSYVFQSYGLTERTVLVTEDK